MNVARRLLKELANGFRYIEQMYAVAGKDCTQFHETYKLFQEWIELHEKMFDHSKYKVDIGTYVEDQKIIKEWLEFHDKIMKS